MKNENINENRSFWGPYNLEISFCLLLKSSITVQCQNIKLLLMRITNDSYFSLKQKLKKKSDSYNCLMVGDDFKEDSRNLKSTGK